MELFRHAKSVEVEINISKQHLEDWRCHLRLFLWSRGDYGDGRKHTMMDRSRLTDTMWFMTTVIFSWQNSDHSSEWIHLLISLSVQTMIGLNHPTTTDLLRRFGHAAECATPNTESTPKGSPNDAAWWQRRRLKSLYKTPEHQKFLETSRRSSSSHRDLGCCRKLRVDELRNIFGLFDL